jgi:beta-glucuronidase
MLVVMNRRRSLLTLGALPVANAPLLSFPAASMQLPRASEEANRHSVSLNGAWRFRRDPSAPWQTVTVPHTWQVEPDHCAHYGDAWYEKAFEAPPSWRDKTVRIEFEAVFHSAVITLNGAAVGEHLRKGYTAFTLDLTPHLKTGRNLLQVHVNNAFDDRMLPRGRSSDWAHDGGIYRPVQLLITPTLFAERLEIDAAPGEPVRARVHIRNAAAQEASGTIAAAILDEETSQSLVERPSAGSFRIPARGSATVALEPLAIANHKLWHFDQPQLYRFVVTLPSGDRCSDTFGIRRIEVRDGAFMLNGERVRLMGVERMAGSHPDFGMAEPSAWIDHDHADMQKLNCIYTRVHWPQDRRVLDYCDRHGILIQTEVPTWGGRTFDDMRDQPDADLMRNGLEQLTEMIARDRNHPCIFSWGVCNEIGGQRPADSFFARRLYQEAKRLDPARLVSYASNSLTRGDPARDVAGEMDYIMWNEYYESWNPGTVRDLAKRLDEIHAAFPAKPIVISEYGYCACTADRPEGDARRIEILKSHNAVFRERPWVAGLIFFCYNDYRTHIGDRGTGVLKQRVHGVVDVYGNRKPSYEVLRSESSLVEELSATGSPGKFEVRLKSRSTVPSATLQGYRLRAVAHGFGGIPVEQHAVALPRLAPGARFEHEFHFEEKTPVEVRVDVLRPGGVPVRTLVWQH